MARDPHWIHAYWEITPSSIKELKGKIGISYKKSAYVLRMYDVSHDRPREKDAGQWVDVDIVPADRNQYINLARGNGAYSADLGVRTPKGAFHLLAHSNVVHTPPSTPSGPGEPVWMKVKHAKGRPLSVVAEAVVRRPRPPKDPDAAVASAKAIGPVPVAAFFEGPGRLEIPIKEECRKWDNCSSAGSAFRQRGPYRESLENMGQGGEVPRGDTSSHAIFKNISPGASEFMYLTSMDTGSHAVARRQRGDGGDFLFEIATDLIVYGRTETGARLLLGEQEIPLRKDGAFSLRFTLPEGFIPLDFFAQSRGMTRRETITASIQRSTFLPI
jgi:hypothetical protein